MTTLLIAVAAMMIGAVIGFLTARLICGTAAAVQLSPYVSSAGDMSSRVEMYRRRAADAKQRAQAKGPSIAIALEYEAAFWLGLAEQLEWTGRGGSVPHTETLGTTIPPSPPAEIHSPASSGGRGGWMSAAKTQGKSITALIKPAAGTIRTVFRLPL